MLKRLRFFLVLITFIPTITNAGLRSLGNLSATDQLALTEMLGLRSHFSAGESLYPLGGHTGLQASVSYRYLTLGQTRDQYVTLSDQPDLGYFELGLAKGLYYNLDFSFTLIPIWQPTRVSGYGGALRWGFYEYKHRPLHLSLILGAQSSNLENKAVFFTQNFDVAAQYTGILWYGYAGFGNVFSKGSFIGGSSGVTLSGASEDVTQSQLRSFIGGGYQLENYSLGGEISFIREPTLNIKITFRNLYESAGIGP